MASTLIHQQVSSPVDQSFKPKFSFLTHLWNAISSFPALLVTILIAKVFWTCRDRIAEPDMWWHLRNARYFVENLHLPDIDTYSFTAAGSYWINHEWLSELFYYSAFRAFGLRGIFILFTFLLAVLLIAVFSICMRETKDPLAAAIATIFGGLLAMVGFTPKTQHFGYLCFVALYAILLRFRSTGKAPLWLLPPLFVLWVNCHGTWLIGLAVYGIFFLAGLVARDLGQLEAAPWSRAERKQLIVVGFASIAALFLNPFGYHLLAYPFDTAFRQQIGVGHVLEWASVDFNDGRGKLVAIVLAAVFALAFVARKRWRIEEAILTGFALFCGLCHIRFLVLAGIVLPPILASKLGRISSYDPQHERRLLNGLLMIIPLAVCLFGFPSEQMLNQQITSYFPARALQFIRTHCLDGHLFNSYQWGGYIEWNLPHTPVFVDSRADIFEHRGVLKDYVDVTNLVHSQEGLERYQVAYVLYAADSPLSYFLSKISEWQCLYRDEQAVIYRRVAHQVVHR